MSDWARQMGARHRLRNQVSSSQVLALADGEKERQTLCLARWPKIVAAMRTLIASYNQGFGDDTIRLVEDPDRERPSVTLESIKPGCGTLVVALEGAELCVRPGGTHTHPGHGQRWIGFNRTDHDTAAYVVQNWMDQL